MAESFPPPPGAPPRQPVRQSTIEAVPGEEEPPPAYTSVVSGQSSDVRVDAGPGRMDFSGPPPLPDRLRPSGTGTGMAHHVTGVGEGYGRRTDGGGGGSGFGPGNPFGDQFQSPQSTGLTSSPSKTQSEGKFDAPSGPPPKSGFGSPPPPQHASSYGAGPSRPPPPTSPSSSAGPSVDLSPTEIPTPGRPLLHNGMMLVYPKGHFCNKCYNTGYKANDPRNPHEADWKKYGKHYNSALALSYKSTGGQTTADNFQRPLPALPPAGPPGHGAGHNPNQWNSFPGHAPPPPQMHQQGSYGPGPGAGPMMSPPPHMMHAPPGPGWGMPAPGPIVYRAGDPRIGGRLCWRCGGDGRETSFFGFDDGKCWECGGIGRVFR